MNKCRICWCTDDRACKGWCEWISDDLCSVCRSKTVPSKHPKHDHYWVESWVLCESYNTIRWMRWRELRFTNCPNTDKLEDKDIKKYQYSLDPIIKK